MSSPHPERPPVTPATLASRLSTMRRELVLPDDALVVRGGVLEFSDLERALEVALVKFRRAGVSVFAADVTSPEALAQSVAAQVPHRKLSFTTMGRLRDAGFEVEQTLEPPHHTVWMPDDDHGFWLQQLKAAFDAPVWRTELHNYRVTGH